MIETVVVDEHALVRAGFACLLGADPDIDVVGLTGTGREAFQLCEELRPDVVLIEFGLPDMDGLEATEGILRAATGARVLVLTTWAHEEYAIRLLRAGASGFLLKSSTPEELTHAVHVVARGGTCVSPAIQEAIIERLAEPQGQTPESVLSNREMQVLVRLASGATSREVAAELCISMSTVETHRSHLLCKLHLRNNADMARFAIRRGLVDAEA